MAKGHFAYIELYHRLEAELRPMFRIKSSSALTPRPAPVSSHPATILVVEDDYALREMLIRALGKRYQVRAAMNGREALQLIAVEKPDLIVSDLSMPHLNGLELLQMLDADPATRDVPFILMTGQPQHLHAHPELRRRLTGYLIKPFELGALFTSVSSVLARRQTG